MATVLVVEDDPTLRMLLSMHLQSASHTVVTATDGLDGLSKVTSLIPDLIVSDYNMPHIDGMAMLAAVRANAPTASIPVIFLTGDTDPEVKAKTLQLGAGAFLTKPFDRKRLLDAVSEQLRAVEGRRIADVARQAAIATDMQLVRDHGAVNQTARMAMLGAPPAEANADDDEDRITDGTVLFLDIREFTTFAEELDSTETVELLNQYFARASVHIVNHAGWIVKFSGDGLIAMFEGVDATGQNHALRGLKAAMFAVVAARDMAPWISARFPGRSLPPFAVGVGVHSGVVSICHIAGGDKGSHTIIGDTVNTAARLESNTKGLGWSIVASHACCSAAGARVRAGREGQLTVKGKTRPVDIVEVLGLTPRAGANAGEGAIYPVIAAAIEANSAHVRASQERAVEAPTGFSARDKSGEFSF